MPVQLTSPQNSQLKEALKLEKRSERAQRRLTLVEGAREVARALEAGILPVEAFVCPAFVDAPAARDALALLTALDAERRCRLWLLSQELFARLAVREESGGIVLVVPYLETRLEKLPLGTPPFLAVIDRPEKPGNLGAILRTADAAGIDGVIVCGGVDVHNPNVVRASLGTLYTVPVAEAAAEQAAGWLRARQIRLVGATPEAHTPYTAVDLTGPVALVMGSEAEGLSPFWRATLDAAVTIPMYGKADSLNLATATALLLYEGVRQRRLALPDPPPPGRGKLPEERRPVQTGKEPQCH
jgi:TrmH family RNA methyltransferase